jgi:hypothetical protein
MNLNSGYAQTFARHKVLFSLPIAITTLLALWFAVGTSKQYRASASIWADTSPPGASSVQANPTLLTEAVQTQQLLAELLTTERFRLAVGRRGPLQGYMAAHPTQGWGPQALMKKLRGSGTATDRTEAALDSAHVFSIADGPHVVTIRFDGPTPAVAVGTLQALIDSFRDELTDLRVGELERTADRLQKQKGAAARSIAALQNKIDRQSNVSSAQLQGWIQARQLAAQRLTKATRSYSEAQLAIDAARAQPSSFHVQDAAKLPAPAVGGMKKTLFVVVAGFFAGALLSFLGVVFLTPDRRRDDDAGQDDDFMPGGDAVSMEAVGEHGSPVKRRSTVKAAGGGRFRR